MKLLDYTVFDVETANNLRESICSIGIERVENGELVFSKEYLINPEMDFNTFNIKIHGITPKAVENEPNFKEIWETISPMFSNTVLIAHNAKSMDLCCLVRALERYDIQIPKIKYVCTLELARKLAERDVESYRLDVLCKHYNVTLEHHHNALNDAKACRGLFEFFNETHPDDIYPKDYIPSESYSKGVVSDKYVYSEKTLMMQQLQVLVQDVIRDGIVTVDEANELLSWMGSHSDLEGFYPYDKLFCVINNILTDGVIDKQEQTEVFDLLDAYINPRTEKSIVSFDGKTVCLSGDFNYGTKSQVEDYITAKGGTIVKTVTKKLDILVLGNGGSVAWKFGNYGTKYENAQKLNERGGNIVVVREEDVIKQNDTQPQPTFIKEQSKPNENAGININISVDTTLNSEVGHIIFEKTMNKLCELVNEKMELAPNEVTFTNSIGKKGANEGQIISYFLQIVERGYPDENTTIGKTSIMRIPASNLCEINLNSKGICDYLIASKIDERNGFIIKEDSLGYKLVFQSLEMEYYNTVLECLNYSLKNYSSICDKFGCCSRYKECEKMGMCIHPNKLYATACDHRKLLKNPDLF